MAASWVNVIVSSLLILENLLISVVKAGPATLEEGQRSVHSAPHPTPPHPTLTFLPSKMKKGKERKKFSKQKLLKGCHQGQNGTVLDILECLKFKTFYCRPNMVAKNTFQCSAVPPL